MKTRAVALLAALVLTVGSAVPIWADPIQIYSPAGFTVPTTVVTFDSYPGGTVANDLYLPSGVQFTRDDGAAVFIYEWAGLGRETTSPPRVLATTGPPWTTHLNVLFDSPMNELGMYFGNDQGFGGFTRATLSVFSVANTLLGAVSVDTNNNVSVDQFIGLISTDAFVRARIDYDGSSLAVVVDDVAFGAREPVIPTVPEPASLFLLGTGLVGIRAWRKRRQ